jgi:hypothetical protein
MFRLDSICPTPPVMLKPKKLNIMTTRIGKIGRLSKDRRHELGHRIGYGSPPRQNENVAGCCTPVAGNVAPLMPDYQRCSGCCTLSDFIYDLPILRFFALIPPPGQNVAGCCHPVAENVDTLIPDYQRCNGCCHFSNFIQFRILHSAFRTVVNPPPLFTGNWRNPLISTLINTN